MRLRDLQEEKYYLIQTDYELSDLLDFIGLPEEYRDDITGAVVSIGDGDYDEIYLTESARYYDLQADYQPLSYYMQQNKKEINKMDKSER